MKKKMSCLLMLLVMMFLLSGCRLYAEYIVNENDTVTTVAKIAYTEQEAACFDAAAKADLTLQTLEDGKKYYVTEEDRETIDLESAQEDEVLLTEDIFFYSVGTSDTEDADDIMELNLAVSLTDDIVESNANVSVDGKKATFSYPGIDDSYWFAYTKAGKEQIEKDTTKPKMKGAKNKKYYKKMPTSIQFTDDMMIRQVTLNGKVVSARKSTTTVNGKSKTIITWGTAKKEDVSKKGKNVFRVTDLNGNTSTFTIYVDNKKPVIKGVKKNKTYKKKATIYVKDASKLSSVTINGKKQKMTSKQLVKKGKYKGYYKYTIKKNGTNKIVAKDAAGNSTTMKITIKR